MAVDARAAVDLEAAASVDVLARDLRDAARMPHVERISLPGDNSNNARERNAREGIPISAPLLRELDKVAAELGVDKIGRAHV